MAITFPSAIFAAQKKKSEEKVVATLQSRSSSTVNGSVTFQQTSENINVSYEIKNLQQGSEHGFHIHEKGDCSSPDAESAEAHFNPLGETHGGHATMVRHAGDLGNLKADAFGTAKGSLLLKRLSVKEIKNRAVLVHESPDDLKSEPAGNSGKRIACGVIQ